MATLLNQDKIRVEILEDGTIRVETDRVSMPNHASAEEFLRLMAELANGGHQDRISKGHTHNQSHNHVHEHM